MSLPFMEPEGKLSCSHEPATGPMLSQIIPIHTISCCFSEIRYIVLSRLHCIIQSYVMKH
jgi:hypothetical protein